MIRHPSLLLVLALPLLAGCVVDCTEIAVASVTVTVSDPDGTRLPEAAVRYLPEAMDWTDHEDCEDVAEEGQFVCGWEVAGNIEIEVSLAGYETHTETGFVDEDECHVIQELLDVVLEPVST